MNSRRYVQRERARRTARTATAIENAALREVARHGYPDLRVTARHRKARAHRARPRARTRAASPLAHALLSRPPRRPPLPGPARRRAPRLAASALPRALLYAPPPARSQAIGRAHV